MGARQTTDSAEFNRLQQVYNQAIEAFEAATKNKKTAKKAYKKAVKANADKQTQFLAFHELESAALLKRLRAFQMEIAKNELKAFVKAQPKVEKSQKQDVPAEMEDAIELESQPVGMHVLHEEVVPQTVHVKGFMPAILEESAEISAETAVVENCEAINEAQAFAHLVENEAVIENFEDINEAEVLAEHQAIAETCEALEAADAKLEIIAALEALDEEKSLEMTRVMEHQAIAEVCEAMETEEAKEITQEVEPVEVAPVMETHVIEYQPVAEVTHVVEPQEVAPVMETHVIEYQPVAEVTHVVDTQEVAPVMETELVEHHAMAAMPEILLNEVTLTHEVIETSIPITEIIDNHTIITALESETHIDDTYDHWERNQKFIGDDLKIIEGIGPKIEQLLNDIGILTYRQLSLMKVEFLEELLKTAGKRYASHDPATWPTQAKLATAGKMADLKQLQERILYGRLDG